MNCPYRNAARQADDIVEALHMECLDNSLNPSSRKGSYKKRGT